MDSSCLRSTSLTRKPLVSLSYSVWGQGCETENRFRAFAVSVASRESCLSANALSSSLRQRAAFSPLQMSGFGFKGKKDTFKYTGTQRASTLGPVRKVPSTVVKPDYWLDGRPKAKAPVIPWEIPVNSEEDLAGIRAGTAHKSFHR